MTEHDIQAKIMIELSELGVVFRTNAGQMYQGDIVYSKEFRQKALINLRVVKSLPEGFSDLLFIENNIGRAAFIEVKTQSGKVKPAQEKFIKRMQSLGCKAGVARTVEDAIRIIKEDK